MKYLVTLTNPQRKAYVAYDYLELIIKSLDKQFFKIKDYCLERHGKYKQLHAHMIVSTNKYFRYKDHVYDVKGFVMHFKPITTDIKTVSQYLHKHCKHHCLERLIHTYLSNYYNNHYGFSNL